MSWNTENHLTRQPAMLTDMFFSCGHATLKELCPSVRPSVREHESKSVRTRIPPLPTRPQLVLAVHPALFLFACLHPNIYLPSLKSEHAASRNDFHATGFCALEDVANKSDMPFNAEGKIQISPLFIHSFIHSCVQWTSRETPQTSTMTLTNLNTVEAW